MSVCIGFVLLDFTGFNCSMETKSHSDADVTDLTVVDWKNNKTLHLVDGYPQQLQ